MRGDLRLAVGEQLDSCLEGRTDESFGKNSFSLAPEVRVSYAKIEKELYIGGVYVSRFLKEPTFNLRDPTAFLELLLKRWDQEMELLLRGKGVPDSRSESGAITADTEQDVLQMVTTAIVYLCKVRDTLCDKLSQWGYVTRCVVLMPSVLEKGLVGSPLQSIVRLLHVAANSLTNVEVLAISGNSEGHEGFVDYSLRSLVKDNLHPDSAFILEMMKKVFEKALGDLSKAPVARPLEHHSMSYPVAVAPSPAPGEGPVRQKVSADDDPLLAMMQAPAPPENQPQPPPAAGPSPTPQYHAQQHQTPLQTQYHYAQAPSMQQATYQQRAAVAQQQSTQHPIQPQPVQQLRPTGAYQPSPSPQQYQQQYGGQQPQTQASGTRHLNQHAQNQQHQPQLSYQQRSMMSQGNSQQNTLQRNQGQGSYQQRSMMAQQSSQYSQSAQYGNQPQPPQTRPTSQGSHDVQAGIDHQRGGFQAGGQPQMSTYQQNYGNQVQQQQPHQPSSTYQRGSTGGYAANQAQKPVSSGAYQQHVSQVTQQYPPAPPEQQQQQQGSGPAPQGRPNFQQQPGVHPNAQPALHQPHRMQQQGQQMISQQSQLQQPHQIPIQGQPSVSRQHPGPYPPNQGAPTQAGMPPQHQQPGLPQHQQQYQQQYQQQQQQQQQFPPTGTPYVETVSEDDGPVTQRYQPTPVVEGSGIDARTPEDPQQVAVQRSLSVGGAPGAAQGRVALLQQALACQLCKVVVEDVLENSTLKDVKDPAAAKVHAIDLLKLLTKDPGYGSRFKIALDDLPAWKKYKSQDHSLYITGHEQRADYFLTDGGASAKKQLLTQAGEKS